MAASLRAELLKLRKRPLVWGLGGLLVTMVVLVGYVFTYVTMQKIAGDPANAEEVRIIGIVLAGENAALVALDIIARFGGPVVLVLGAITAGSEYVWNTVKTVLTQRGRRSDILLGTVGAYAVVLGVIVLASVVAASLASLAVSAISDVETGFLEITTLFPAMGAMWLSLAAWTLFGAVLAGIFRNAAGAVAVGLVYALALENAVALLSERFQIVAYVAKAMIGQNAAAFTQTFIPDGIPAGPAAIDPLQATLVLMAIVAGSVIVMLTFLRRDYA